MSPYLMHTDTSVYSKPFEFMPERWLDENFNPNMMRNFVPFARGMSIFQLTIPEAESLMGVVHRLPQMSRSKPSHGRAQPCTRRVFQTGRSSPRAIWEWYFWHESCPWLCGAVAEVEYERYSCHCELGSILECGCQSLSVCSDSFLDYVDGFPRFFWVWHYE